MHTCPDCGQACSCSGDIEDHDTGDEFYDDCSHHLRCMDDDDDEPWLDDAPRVKGQASPELQKVLADALSGNDTDNYTPKGEQK